MPNTRIYIDKVHHHIILIPLNQCGNEAFQPSKWSLRSVLGQGAHHPIIQMIHKIRQIEDKKVRYSLDTPLYMYCAMTNAPQDKS